MKLDKAFNGLLASFWVSLLCINGNLMAADSNACACACVTVVMASAGKGLADPHAMLWRDIPEYLVDTAMAPPVHQSTLLRVDPSAAPVPLGFKIASDGDTVLIRLRWSDTTNNSANAFEKFADGAAVQFALKGAHQTFFMMGGPETPVNIWYWRAGAVQAQNLAALGFGSLTTLERQDVAAKASYSTENGGEWTLVLSRPIASAGDYQVDLTAPLVVSFALWQGEDKQRDGFKRVSSGWVTVAKDDRRTQ